MAKLESIQEFYNRIPGSNPLDLPMHNAGAGHFNVFKRSPSTVASPHIRKDFYKVTLLLGTAKIHYADKWIHVDRPALMFSNPSVPYSCEPVSERQEGWFCIFNEAFLLPGEHKGILKESPLFSEGSHPIFFLDTELEAEISGIYKRMELEIASDYPQKYSMLGNYLDLIIHHAMKMRPAQNYEKQVNASSRITTLFFQLLERQFPIHTPDAALKLKTANDYAAQLSIHANHLNRSVKEITGKTTTEHIAARLIQEAQALLQHTDWNIAEIAFSLGFEYSAYFNNFFKKNTGITPREARAAII